MKEATQKKNIADAIAKRIAEGKALPKVGQGAAYGIGSDHYGYQVTSVADDLSWFTYGCTNLKGELANHGVAKLCVRKNSKAFGHYIDCRQDFPAMSQDDYKDLWINPSKWSPRAPWSSCGSRYYNVVGLTGHDGEEPTFLDPSF